MYTDVDDQEIASVCSVEYVTERQVLFEKAFALTRATLGNAAERSKKTL